MKRGDKFLMLRERFPIELRGRFEDSPFGLIITFDRDDGGYFIPYRFVYGDTHSNNGFWLGKHDINLLIPYDFSDKEIFIFTLSGQVPERYL